MAASSDGEKLIAQIYKKLGDAWDIAGIDRHVSFREVVFAPAYGQHARPGAGCFLAALCYPEDRSKRAKFLDALSAEMLKSAGEPRSRERRELRQDKRISSLLDMPNKRIQQVLSHALKRLNTRLRAAWVLSQKYVSSGDPHFQKPLRDIMLRAARQNTRQYPAFDSSEADEEQVITSFRQRVMAPSRPVFHLAMAFYELLSSRGVGGQGVFTLVNSAEDWLADCITKSEYYRVMGGDLFPAHGSQYLFGRSKNVSTSTTETIAVLPYDREVHTRKDWDELQALELGLNWARHR